MSIALFKTATKTVLDAVTGVDANRVYKAQRLLENDADVKTIMLNGETTINAWFISGIGFDDKMKSIGGGGFNMRTYRIEVIGYYTINDTTDPMSEEVFENLCEDISDDVAANIRAELPASSHILDFPSFELGYAVLPSLGNILVHRARANMTANLWHQRG